MKSPLIQVYLCGLLIIVMLNYGYGQLDKRLDAAISTIHKELNLIYHRYEVRK